MPLQHLAYLSKVSHALGDADIDAILATSRGNNQKRGITGHLQRHGDFFFQILEGPSDNLDQLLAKLHDDPRHEQIRLLFREPMPRRSFADWSMGFSPDRLRGARNDALEKLHAGGAVSTNRVLSLFLTLIAR